MNDYIFKMIWIVLLCSFIEMLINEGKTKDVVRVVYSLVILISIVQPLVSVTNNGLQFDFDSITVTVDNSFSDYVDNYKEVYYETKYKKMLKDDNLIVEYLLVDIENGILKKISIKLSNLVIKDESLNINSNVIKKHIAKVLNVDHEVIDYEHY